MSILFEELERLEKSLSPVECGGGCGYTTPPKFKKVKEVLMKAVKDERDPHIAVAAYMQGKEEKDVTPEERQMAKGVNYIILYS